MLKNILKERQRTIVERWLTDTLSCYQPGAAQFFRKTADPFANPVGHALIKGTTSVFEFLLGERTAESVRRDLDDVVKVRAVQDLSPSQALSFVFLLKAAVRTELGAKTGDPGLTCELRDFESGIDQVALMAFEAYVDCRERISRLRVEEVQRNVSAMMIRFNGTVRSRAESSRDKEQP